MLGSLSQSNIYMIYRWCIWYEPLFYYDFEKVHFNVRKDLSARNLCFATFLFKVLTFAICLLKLVHVEDHSQGSFSTLTKENVRCSLMVDVKAMKTISRPLRRAFILANVSHWDIHVLALIQKLTRKPKHMHIVEQYTEFSLIITRTFISCV